MRDLMSTAWYLVRGFLAAIVQHWGLALLSVALGLSLWLFVTDRENPTEAQTFNGNVAIKFVNVPNNLAVSNVSETSVSLRIEAPKNDLSGLRAEDFEATVDLGGVAPGTSNLLVNVTPSNSRINIVSVSPARVDVTVENQRSKEVPVRVALTGSPQQGFAAGGQDVTPSTATVTGAESLVALVDHVSAEVNLTGLRVDFTDDRVELKPRDVREGEISRVKVNPATASVSVQIEQREFSLEFAITPSITGAPATGYDVGQITIEPRIVTVTGPLEALQSIDAVKGLSTEEISIADARSDVVRQVQPILPANVRLQGSPTVRVTVGIAPARGEATFQVVPQVRGVEGGLTLASPLTPVSVTLAGDVPTLQTITPEAITVVADAQGLDAGLHPIPLTITPPNGTSVVRSDPGELGVALVPQ
jgi:YbbR domain-containing protein